MYISAVAEAWEPGGGG